MKTRSLLIFFLFNSIMFGQSSNTTVLYGTVTAADKEFKPFCYSCVSFTYKTQNENENTSVSVDKDGRFHGFVPKDTEVHIYTYYADHHETDIDLFTGGKDSIRLDLNIRAKQYVYTKNTALKDIANGLVRIITSDSIIYDWNKKLNYTKTFGFQYTFVPYPEDVDFRNNIDQYNSEVGDHLLSIDPTWYEHIFKIEDSLVHLKADTYAKDHPVDLKKLEFPKGAKLSKTMIRSIEEQRAEFERLFRDRIEKYIVRKPEYYIDKVENDIEYQYVFESEYVIAFYYEELVPEFIRRITDTKKVGLKNTADLIIWERIESGDLEFYGHGGIATDDLFTVAGRANHLLKKATGEDFGNVSMYSTPDDLKRLQGRWIYWLINIRQ